MASTDSVTIFAEGSFQEQILELVDYLARSIPEPDRPNFLAPFQERLKPNPPPPENEDEENDEVPTLTEEEIASRKTVLSLVVAEVKGLGEGSDKEVEGFYNLLFVHLTTAFPLDSPELKQHIQTLLDSIVASSKTSTLQYRILSFLFNALPSRSPLRLLVYKVLLSLASSRDELEIIQVTQVNVERWIKEWEIPSEEKSSFLKSLTDAFAKADHPITSYEYLLSYLRSLPPSSPEAQTAAIDAISTALRLPSIFDFDTLYRYDAVINLGNHELFALLKIFLSGGIDDCNSWISSHADAINKYNLDQQQLSRKIRLLTFASLGCENIGKDLPYSAIATTINVDVADVEKWSIDVIRAGLLSGKLSQTSHILHVTRSSARTFEKEQWETLERRLVAWKTGLASVLDVVATALNNNRVGGGDGQQTNIRTSETVTQTSVAV